MISRYYGIYDSCSKEFVRTFVARNDDEAVRASEYVVRENGFDDIAGKDRSIHYLYTLDTGSGKVVDNEPCMLCSLATSIEARKRELLEHEIQQKLCTEDFVNLIKEKVLATAIMEEKANVRKAS